MAPPSPKQRRENRGERAAEQGGGASAAAVVCGGVDRRWLPAWLSRRERWNRGGKEQGKRCWLGRKQRRGTGEMFREEELSCGVVFFLYTTHQLSSLVQRAFASKINFG